MEMPSYSDIITWIPFFGSLIIAVVLFISVLIAKKSFDQQTHVSYSQLIRDFDHDISDQERRIPNMQSTSECIDHAIHYINILERIAFLYKEKKLPDFKVVNFFSNNFEIGMAFEEWLKKVDDDDQTGWVNFREFCKKNKIKPYHKGIEDVVEKYGEFTKQA